MNGSNKAFLAKCEREYIAQLERCNNPEEAVDSVFFDILDQLENTVFYNENDLKNVKTIDEFKNQIPIRSYQDFDYYINLQMKGAQNVLSKSKCFAFYKTSGTSGKSKFIPSTYHWRQEYRGPALYAQWGLYFKLINIDTLKDSDVLDISWSRKKSEIQTGFPLYSITSRPSALDGNDWNPPWHDSNWFMYSDAADHTESVLDLLAATVLNDVKIIVSVNPSKIASLYEIVNANLEPFIKKLSTLREKTSAREQQGKLDSLIEKINENQQINLVDLWPGLSLLVCWRSASAGKYLQWLNSAAPEVPVVPFSTVGTEGIVTIPVDSSHTGGALSINQGLYEFVDVDTLDNPSAPLAPSQKTLNFDQVEVGKSYRLVMSQANGIYRYDTHDVYKVVGWVGKTPRIDFVGRSNIGSSFTGEKLSEDNIYDAVYKTLHGVCGKLPFFTCIPVWGAPPRYIIAIEAKDNNLIEHRENIEKELEENLCEVNEEYVEKRDSERLEPLSLILLKPGAFGDINKININNGVSSAQVKHLWIQPGDNLMKIFYENGLVIESLMEAS